MWRELTIEKMDRKMKSMRIEEEWEWICEYTLLSISSVEWSSGRIYLYVEGSLVTVHLQSVFYHQFKVSLLDNLNPFVTHKILYVHMEFEHPLSYQFGWETVFSKKKTDHWFVCINEIPWQNPQLEGNIYYTQVV